MSVSTPRISPRDATSPTFRVRTARRGDIDALAQLLTELGYADAADTSIVHWVVSHPEVELFVASDAADRPIGMVSLSHYPQLRLKGRMGVLDELVVASAWRRKGVGRALMEHVVARARTLGVKRLELTHHQELGEPATAFFQACGFETLSSAVFRHPGLDFTRAKR